MKVYALPQNDSFAENDYGINRISKALIKHTPPGIEIVYDESEADMVIFYAHGLRKKIWWAATKLLDKGKKFAVIQLCVRTTQNPKTDDWLKIWEKASLVYSYYKLPVLCAEDGNQANFNFLHGPLGVDAEAFKETKSERKYLIGIHSKGWSRESLRDVWAAAQAVGGTVLNFNNALKGHDKGIDYVGDINTGDSAKDDRILASYYSQCKYVSGLRRVEGFEMPVLEGLMGGARPVCFDVDCYRTWFDGFAEFISDEGGSAKIIPNLVEVLKNEPKPVSDEEKAKAAEKFNWETIAHGFWERLIASG